MRIAVVGLGSIGRRHVRILNEQFPDIEIIAVRSGRGGSVPEDDMVEWHVRSVGEALEYAPTGGIIANPAPYHVDEALKFLRVGLPVLIEKPVAADYTDARRLLSEEQTNAEALSRSAVGYVLRHQPAFQFVRSTIQSGKLGTPRSAHAESHSYLPSWRPGQDYRQSVSAEPELGGGVLRELSHEIDYVIELLGECHAVIAWRNQESSLNTRVEEHAELVLQHLSDAVTTISLDFATQGPPRRKLSVSFSKGVLTWDLLLNAVEVSAYEEEPVRREFPAKGDDMFARQIADFVKALSGQNVPECRITDALKTMAIVDAAERSYVSLAWEAV